MNSDSHISSYQEFDMEPQIKNREKIRQALADISLQLYVEEGFPVEEAKVFVDLSLEHINLSPSIDLMDVEQINRIMTGIQDRRGFIYSHLKDGAKNLVVKRII